MNYRKSLCTISIMYYTRTQNKLHETIWRNIPKTHSVCYMHTHSQHRAYEYWKEMYSATRLRPKPVDVMWFARVWFVEHILLWHGSFSNHIIHSLLHALNAKSQRIAHLSIGGMLSICQVINSIGVFFIDTENPYLLTHIFISMRSWRKCRFWRCFFCDRNKK